MEMNPTPYADMLHLFGVIVLASGLGGLLVGLILLLPTVLEYRRLIIRRPTARLCGYHTGLYLRPGQLAVLDSKNCEACRHEESTKPIA